MSIDEAYAAPRPRHAERPWVGLCMVSSLDGSIAVEGSSAALGGDADRAVLVTLRKLADIVVVGAATVRAEGYGVPSKAGQRVGIVSTTGDLDFSTKLFTSGAGFLILPESAPPVPVDSIRAGATAIDFAAAFSQIDADFIQAEGGATLNGALAAADLIDELNLTVSPVFCGGAGPRLTTAAPPMWHPMKLAHVLQAKEFLFMRYLRDRAGTSAGA